MVCEVNRSTDSGNRRQNTGRQIKKFLGVFIVALIFSNPAIACENAASKLIQFIKEGYRNTLIIKLTPTSYIYVFSKGKRRLILGIEGSQACVLSSGAYIYTPKEQGL